jgi:hypothetical protein
MVVVCIPLAKLLLMFKAHERSFRTGAAAAAAARV